MDKIIRAVLVALLATILTYGQDATTLDDGRDSAITKTLRRSEEKVDLEPFIGDSLNNLDIELLTKMRAQTYEDDRISMAAGYHLIYRTIDARCGKELYMLRFRGPKIKEICTYSINPEFQVKGLHIGDTVDISKYEKAGKPDPIFSFIREIYSYRIPGTEWLFREDNGIINYFWRMCSESSLLVDEVMLENR